VTSVLRIFGVVFVLAGLAHVVFGVGAEALLGANLPLEALKDPSLNSQNRFYGAEFMLYGVVIWMFTSDRRKYADVFRAVMILFFVGGLTRILSYWIHGAPSLAIQFLAMTELVIPPVLLRWQARCLNE
jgi:hypothetical protein